MTTHDDAPPPRRHLHPVEPPFDPDYDTRPHPVEQAAAQAERALLGTLLTHPEHAADILPALDPRDFHTPAHEAIWNAAAHLLSDGVIPEHPALLRQLANDPVFQRAGGHQLLLDLRPDADPSGQPEHNAKIVREAASLRRLGTALAAARAAHTKADPANIRATLEQLVDLADTAATTFGPPNQANTTGLHDLSWILTGQPPVVPPPIWCTRTDGTALFYDAKVNGVFGDPECGKTWLAQTAIVEALHQGRMAAMIDVDHNGPDHTAARLALLGARWEDIANPQLFRYYEPEDADQLHAAVADVVRHTPAVVLIDSLGEIFPMLGVNTNDGDEITTAMRQICTRIAVAGPCVITIDHLPKSQDARSTGYAIGSIAKKRMIRGSYLRAEARTQPAPGAVGRITLRIEKDTAGELRKSSGGGYAGTLVLDSTHEHITSWTIAREIAPKNEDGTFRPTGYMEKVAHFVADNAACTQNDIEAGIPGTAKHIRTALQILVTEGHITRSPGPRRSWLHTLTIPYREAEDDNAQPTL